MKIIVVIPTFYASTQDDDNNIRYNLALETCRAIANANSNNDSDSGNTDFVLQGLIVDASPDETVRQSMFDAGKGHIKVVKQTYQGKKGAALREGIALAAAAAAAAAGGGGIFCTKVVVNGSESQTVRNDHEVYAHQGMPRTDTKFYGYPIKNFQETSILYQYPFFVATCV